MLYQLVLELSRSSFVVSQPKLSIRSILVIPNEEETIQQAQGDLEMEQLDQELHLPIEIKQ